MSEKPGVMIYFEIMETVRLLNDTQAATLFRAILEYGITKKEPQLPDDLLILWPLIRMRLDTDDDRYYKVAQKKRYGAYVRWARYNNSEPLPFEQWVCNLDRFEDEEARLEEESYAYA